MDELSILAIGDVHITVSNIGAVSEMVEALINVAKERKPDLIILLGDILHTHETIHSDALNIAIGLIKKLSKIGPPLILIIGNHDLINNQQFLTDRHGFNAVKTWDNVTVVDKCIHHIIKGHRLVYVPYVPPGRFIEALETNEDCWKEATCIFGHQEFKGCKMGSIISEEGDKWDEENPLVITGHIHDRQIPQKNIIYPGTPMQHSFGDTVKKTIGLFKFKNDEMNYEKIDLRLPRKITFTFELPEVNVDKIIKKVNNRDSIKVILKGRKEQYDTFRESKEYKKLEENGVRVMFKAIREMRVELPESIKNNVETDEDVCKMSENGYIEMLRHITKEKPLVSRALEEVLVETYRKIKIDNK